jgi:hypothetical protein
MRRQFRRITFILGWLVVLAIAQISLNPTIGLLAVVLCAVHIGVVLGHRGKPHASLGSVLWLARQIVGAPLQLAARLRRRRPGSTQAAAIGIEVHVDNRRRSAEIERLLRATLRQCERTWAPHPLPVNRITVHAGAPPTGRAQLYEQWLPTEDDQRQESWPSLAVISLGLLDATGRPLENQQLAGALATQVASLVADRYQRQHANGPAACPIEAKPAPHLSRSAADLVDLVDPASVDGELGVLMDRLRHQARPLESEPVNPPAAN